jgi:hypothetical protein
MPRSIKTMKLCATALSVVAAAAVPGGVAVAQSSSGPSLHGSYSGPGAATQSGPNGPLVPSTGSASPAAPAASTTYGSKVSGSGTAVRSYAASQRDGDDAAGPSLHNSDSGSGAGTQSGPNGPFVPGTGSAPPVAPAGSTTYNSKESGPGKAVKSRKG